MPSNSIDILTQNAHPDDSTATVITSEKYRGDGYYGRADGLHTIHTNLAGFVGKIEIQGTLAIDPTSDDWFTVELGTGSMSVDTTGIISEENITFVEYDEAITITDTYNFTGNYVWVRAYVSNWTEGTVNYIKLNH
jgi:hypothetical protein